MEKVYIVQTENKTILGVYCSAQAAFRAIGADNANITLAQCIRTEDGEEEITPTPDNFVSGKDIFRHTDAIYSNMLGIAFDAEDDVIIIREMDIKD